MEEIQASKLKKQEKLRVANVNREHFLKQREQELKKQEKKFNERLRKLSEERGNSRRSSKRMRF